MATRKYRYECYRTTAHTHKHQKNKSHSKKWGKKANRTWLKPLSSLVAYNSSRLRSLLQPKDPIWKAHTTGYHEYTWSNLPFSFYQLQLNWLLALQTWQAHSHLKASAFAIASIWKTLHCCHIIQAAAQMASNQISCLPTNKVLSSIFSIS